MTAASRFDPATGTLRLTRSGRAALAALVDGDVSSLDAATVDELAGGEIVVDQALHPRLVPVARCLATTHVRLSLGCTSPSPVAVEGWVDERIAVLARSTSPEGGSVADVIAVPRGMLAFQLARLLRFRPRPRPKVMVEVEVDEALLEAVLVPGDALSAAEIHSLLSEIDEVTPEWLDLLAKLSEGPIGRWRVGAWWNSAEESPKARLLEVVESDLGRFLVTHLRRPDRPYRRASLHPITGTQLWRLICALVPPSEEVAGPLDP